jgi:hypothetical protein
VRRALGPRSTDEEVEGRSDGDQGSDKPFAVIGQGSIFDGIAYG